MTRRIMLVAVSFLVAGALSVIPTEAFAEQEGPQIEGIDLMVGGGIGGSYFSGRYGVPIFVRLRRVPETPVGLEVNLYSPFGIGAGLIFDVLRVGNFRLHMFDVGVFYSWKRSLRPSVHEIDRDYDLTLGAGIEWKWDYNWWITLDVRFFFPDLYRVISYYGDFARQIYSRAARGGHICFGLVYEF
jgi:hypothetical protein